MDNLRLLQTTENPNQSILHTQEKGGSADSRTRL